MITNGAGTALRVRGQGGCPMSYYHTARKAGTCKAFVREEEDYIYDAPYCSTTDPYPAPRISYDAIAHAVHASRITPDAWESRWLEIGIAA